MTKTAQPMIQLEPNGVAPMLSYKVPEAISHSGRNFIDLRIPDSCFIKLPRIPSRLPRAQKPVRFQRRRLIYPMGCLGPTTPAPSKSKPL
ncbi:hypothetical protein sS8_0799 [Methylocaldum marinum]|uniref:Uncharacterized protein n=1 Tax=Methylocaldum marinum TaxID=1432792 RepID=A0A250KMI2_9GAMM|nr:hypothetical protein sS8_0799 [Methylocaldum marinum]